MRLRVNQVHFNNLLFYLLFFFSSDKYGRTFQFLIHGLFNNHILMQVLLYFEMLLSSFHPPLDE